LAPDSTVLITLAGTPTQTENGGTSLSTTALAPIWLSCPMVIGPTMTAPQPMSTRSSMIGLSERWSLRRAPPKVVLWRV
jgi:hypothetical protein